MKSSLIFLTALFAFTTSVHGSFSQPDLMNKLPIKGGMILAQANNSLYFFGGLTATSVYSNELYKLTLIDSIYNWEVLPQKNPPDGTIYGQGFVTSDNQNLIIMGGVSAVDNTISELNLQIYTYNFVSQTWTASASNNDVVSDNQTSTLFNRQAISATYNPKTQQTYVYGGSLPDGSSINTDFGVLDANFKVTKLSSPSIFGHYGHTASLTSDGKIVVLGGIINTLGGQATPDLRTIYVYTVATNTWDTIIANASSGNVYPPGRSGHNAVVNSDDQIIIFGGGKNSDIRGNTDYLNDIAILNTKTWTWTIPTVSGTPPSNRTYASAGLLDGKTLTVAFGESPENYCNDINVYDFSTSSWIQKFSESSSNSSTGGSTSDSNGGEQSVHNSSGVSKGLIAGVTVAGVVVVLIIVFLLWKFKFCSGGKSWAVRDRIS